MTRRGHIPPLGTALPEVEVAELEDRRRKALEKKELLALGADGTYGSTSSAGMFFRPAASLTGGNCWLEPPEPLDSRLLFDPFCIAFDRLFCPGEPPCPPCEPPNLELKLDIQEPRREDPFELVESCDDVEAVDFSEVDLPSIPGLFENVFDGVEDGGCGDISVSASPPDTVMLFLSEGVPGGCTGSPPFDEVFGGASFARPGDVGARIRW